MEEITYDVPGVSCEHCVNAITKATKNLGVNDVQVDLVSKKVYVAFNPEQVSEAGLKEAIEDEGYDVTGQTAGRAIPNAGAGKKTLDLKSK